MRDLKTVALIILVSSTMHAMDDGKAQQEWHGKYYDENSDPQFNTAAHLIETKIKFDNLADCTRILDVGCGTGKVTRHLHMHTIPGTAILGVDASESMIAQATENYKTYQTDGLTFHVADAQKLTFSNEMDLVTCFAAAHWIPNKEALFRGVGQALKPGGTMLMTCSMKQANGTATLAALKRLAQNEKWKLLIDEIDISKEFFPLESIEQAEQLLKANSLSPVEISTDTRPYVFKNKEALAAWLPGWFGAFKAFNQINPIQRREFLRDLVEQYVQVVPIKKDGAVEFPRSPLVILAKKMAQQ